jgi:glutamyl-tRNA reductase
VNSFKIISITHKLVHLDLIGKLHLDETNQQHYLGAAKMMLSFKELMFLSTCNRVEFLVVTEHEISEGVLSELYRSINSRISDDELKELINGTSLYENEKGLTHLFEVSSSLDSLVVGEREIITQVRKAYEYCNILGLTGDVIRLAIKQTIETAKQVFTDTDIAKNPVSIVSLAYRQLRNLGIKNNARVLFIGAGETNISMSHYLKKHQYANFTVFNRTLSNAITLADSLKGQAFDLSELPNYKEGFDVLISCTSSQKPIVTESIYKSLLQGDKTKKVIIDLAIPADIERSVIENYDIKYIDIESLKKQAEENLLKRQNEIDACNKIIYNKVEEFKLLFQERKIELAFGEIPKKIKQIKHTAIHEVFAKEVNSLDENGKMVLDKLLSYMEKKYNALAIKTAKRVLLEEDASLDL